MPRQSSVRRLPPELREQLGALLDQGRTLNEIREHLSALGAEVSRSALGRFKQHIDKVGERIRRSREMAEVLMRRLGDAPESKTARWNIELLHGCVNDLMAQTTAPGEEADGKAVLLSPQGAMLLAKAVDHLTRAAKSDAELVTRIRDQARKEADARLDKAVDAATGQAKRENLTPEQVLARVKAIYRGEA